MTSRTLGGPPRKRKGPRRTTMLLISIGFFLVCLFVYFFIDYKPPENFTPNQARQYAVTFLVVPTLADGTTLEPETGTEEDFARFVQELGEGKASFVATDATEGRMKAINEQYGTIFFASDITGRAADVNRVLQEKMQGAE